MRFGRRGVLGSLVLAALVALIVLAPDDRDDGGEGSGEPVPGSDSAFASVIEVVDGDTIDVMIGGEQESVRYIGIDTPESNPDQPYECYGNEASALNERLVAGRRVRLVFDAERRDVYGRLLAYVYVGPRFVNAEILRRGFARTLTIAPNDTNAEFFARLQQRAGRAGRGLWSACSP